MSRFNSFSLRLLIGAGLAGAVVVGAAAPASAQNLFDLIFGGNRAPEPAPYYERARPRPPVDTERGIRVIRPGDDEGPRKRVFVEPPKPGPYVAPEVMPGAVGQFLRDPTLRAGDVVVGKNGLMVFQGSSGSGVHRDRDFVPVQRAARVAGSRSKLAAIERANKREQRALVSVQIVKNYRDAKPKQTAPIVATDDAGARKGSRTVSR